MTDTCVVCGAVIDKEGSLVCWCCEHDDMYTVNTDLTNPLIIAVDFDGTLCADRFPEIGAPNELIIGWLKMIRREGHKLILWTCRVDERLREAVRWCADLGLYFDTVNDNIPENVAKYGTNPRKVFADLYIDDKSVDGFRNAYDISKINYAISRRNKHGNNIQD